MCEHESSHESSESGTDASKQESCAVSAARGAAQRKAASPAVRPSADRSAGARGFRVGEEVCVLYNTNQVGLGEWSTGTVIDVANELDGRKQAAAT